MLCPNCAAGRIAELRQRKDELPDGLAELEQELAKRVEYDREEEEDSIREHAVRRRNAAPRERRR